MILRALLIAAALPSCVSMGEGGSSAMAGKSAPKITPRKVIKIDPKKADWNSMADVKAAFAGQPVKITGSKLDLNNCEIEGSRFPKPKDRDSESSAGIHTRIPGFYLANGYVTGFPGGIMVKEKGTTFYDLVFSGRVEDHLSNQLDATPGMRVMKCRFYNSGGDKSLQLNDAKDAEVSDCYFTGGITAVRLQKKATKQKGNRATVTGNTFDSVDTAWNIAGGVKVSASGNKYANVNTRWVTDSGATHTEK